jgi:GTP-sensing pleiotropic transcriptional regulator CodY
MPRKRDEESGKYTDSYSDVDFISAIKEAEGVAGTQEVAEKVGCSHRQALNRLKNIEDSGAIVSKDVGQSLVWQLAEDS